MTHFLSYQEAMAECPDAVADIIRQVNASRKKPPKTEAMTWMLCAGEDARVGTCPNSGRSSPGRP